LTLTYRQKRALQAFRAFAREFPIEQAIESARKSVRMPEKDWLYPQLSERMADIAAELHSLGELADTKESGQR
jgi:hypothetical protein